MVKKRRQLLVPVIFALIVVSPSYVVSLRNDILRGFDNHSLDDDDFDLLIVSPLKFKLPLQKLVNHKEEIGIETELVTTEKIYQNLKKEFKLIKKLIKKMKKRDCRNYAASVIIGTTCFLRDTTPSSKAVLSSNLTP